MAKCYKTEDPCYNANRQSEYRQAKAFKSLAQDVQETINRLCPVLPDMTEQQTSERTRRIAAAQHYAHLYPHKAAQHTGVPYAAQQAMAGVMQ